jgi:hypothetical protein
VFTIDRNFGIEYFDNPRTGGGAVRSYLIDYSPEFLDGVGHRLIISTFWLSEIEGIISDGLRKMGIPGTGFHATQILDVLKSVSGRLALKLINNPKDAKEIIGLALTRLLLQDAGALKTGVLIPVDSHIDLFAEHKRDGDDSSIRLQRTDLLLIRAQAGKLVFRLIEVKYRTSAGGAGEDTVLKEAIASKNADTRKVFQARFVPKAEKDRLDRELQNKELANLIHFYMERARRHGLLGDGSQGAAAIQEALRGIEAGQVQVEFEQAGYIYHTEGQTKPTETYKDNQIFVVGRQRIFELLGIEEEPPESEPPPPPPELRRHPLRRSRASISSARGHGARAVANSTARFSETTIRAKSVAGTDRFVRVSCPRCCLARGTSLAVRASTPHRQEHGHRRRFFGTRSRRLEEADQSARSHRRQEWSWKDTDSQCVPMGTHQSACPLHHLRFPGRIHVRQADERHQHYVLGLHACQGLGRGRRHQCQPARSTH